MALGTSPVPATGRKARRHEAARAEIVAAAWMLVRRVGLGGLSLKDLAASVGMTAPSLYSYFDSKYAIYDAMFKQGWEEMARRDDILDDTPGPAPFKARVRAFLSFCTEDPARYQLLFQRTLPGFTPSAESYAVAEQVLDRAYRALAANGITSQAHRDLYTSWTSGLADQQIANDLGGDRWVRLADEASDMFLAHVLPRGPGPGRAQTTTER